jgi:hypothetical protein
MSIAAFFGLLSVRFLGPFLTPISHVLWRKLEKHLAR